MTTMIAKQTATPNVGECMPSIRPTEVASETAKAVWALGI